MKRTHNNKGWVQRQVLNVTRHKQVLVSRSIHGYRCWDGTERELSQTLKLIMKGLHLNQCTASLECMSSSREISHKENALEKRQVCANIPHGSWRLAAVTQSSRTTGNQQKTWIDFADRCETRMDLNMFDEPVWNRHFIKNKKILTWTMPLMSMKEKKNFHRWVVSCVTCWVTKIICRQSKEPLKH